MSMPPPGERPFRVPGLNGCLNGARLKRHSALGGPPTAFPRARRRSSIRRRPTANHSHPASPIGPRGVACPFRASASRALALGGAASLSPAPSVFHHPQPSPTGPPPTRPVSHPAPLPSDPPDPPVLTGPSPTGPSPTRPTRPTRPHRPTPTGPPPTGPSRLPPAPAFPNQTHRPISPSRSACLVPG